MIKIKRCPIRIRDKGGFWSGCFWWSIVAIFCITIFVFHALHWHPVMGFGIGGAGALGIMGWLVAFEWR